MTLCFPVEKISCVIQDPRVSSWTCTHRVVASSGQPNYLSVRLQVPSRLNMQMWCALLLDYPDNIIFDILEFGWLLGYCGEAVPSLSLPYAITVEHWIFRLPSKHISLVRIISVGLVVHSMRYHLMMPSLFRSLLKYRNAIPASGVLLSI